ncbi:MAG: TrmH family RNA methyltransferase, partial [bacterium]
MARVALLVESLNNPGNVGAIMRTAEVFAVNKLILYGNKSFAKGITKGGHKWVDLEFARDPSCLEPYRAAGYRITGIENGDGAKSLHGYQFAADTVLVLGNEVGGVGKALLAELDDMVIIPQFGLT